MSIRSFQDFHGLNEGKKLRDWQYTGTVSVGSNNAIYYQYPNNVKYYVSITPEELEDYSEGGSLKKKLEKQWADSGKAMTRDEFEAKYLPKGPQGLGKYLSQGGRMWDHLEHNDLNEADTWTVYYKKGSLGREVVKSGLSKQAATRLYNKLSADIPSEYDGVEMVMEAASDAQIKKVMKLAKDRPAPFAVVAVKGGKVVAQDIDIKTWELVLAHYREMAKAHPDAKIHVEDAEGQSVMESVDMLPSYEVLIGLATVLGALDLAQAARGGDSIIVDVAKALKAELGDKLEATGAEAKRVIDKFKGSPKVKEIIMDAEEEVNESLTESVNEATETGLMVVPRTNADANKIQKWVDKSGMYGEWDAREGYFLFPEEEDGFDELEAELTKELDKLGVNYRIEGIFESKKSNQMSIKKFESYFGDDQLNEAASGDLIEKMDKALKDFEETLGDLEFYWGQLSMAADKIGKAMAGGDDSKEMRQAWYRASMAQRNAAKQAMRMLK
jgi:hypothetical protein